MHRRYNLAHSILAGIVVLVLTLLIVAVNAQARIAFVSDRDGNWEIYVMDADGGNQQRLTENLFDDWDPLWAPDGKRIAFASDKKGDYEIYVTNTNGRNLQNLTNNPNHDVNPAWLNSPFLVSSGGKKFMMWGWLQQTDR